MKNLNQVEQSDQFNKLFLDQVAQSKERLLVYGKQVVEQSSLKHTNIEAFQEALVCADGGDLQGLFTILRYHTQFFVRERYSSFWGWIDAVGFHFDATCAQWPYITLNDRTKYLQWSTQMIEETFTA